MPTAFDENGRPIIIVYDEQGNPQRADARTRLAMARGQMEDSATARAMQTRSGVDAEDERISRQRAFADLERRANAGDPDAIAERRQRERDLEMQMRAREPGAAGTAVALTASIPLVGGLVTAPVATGKALLGGVVGGVGGKEAGQWLGQRMPIVGGETAGKVLGGVGGLVGGGIGASTASRISGARLLNMLSGGRLGPLIESAPATAPLSEAAKQRLANEAERIALRRKSVELAERRLAIAEDRAAKVAQRVSTKAGRPVAVQTSPESPATTAAASAPPTRGATALASETTTQPVAASQADEIAAKIIQWKTQNKWSGAQIESALRNVYGISPRDGRKMVQMVMEAQGVSPLQASRVQVGAQRVGRSVGMTKEEVRQVAGPVLDELRGEASPILPRQALQSIIDTMKAMPMAEREAYVARATSGKAKWQIENIRRTLEHLGLLLPLGAAGAMAASSRPEGQ